MLEGQGGGEFAVYCAGETDSGGLSIVCYDEELEDTQLTLPHQASGKEKRTIYGFGFGGEER